MSHPTPRRVSALVVNSGALGIQPPLGASERVGADPHARGLQSLRALGVEDLTALLLLHDIIRSRDGRTLWQLVER